MSLKQSRFVQDEIRSDMEKNARLAELLGWIPCDDPLGRCEGAKMDPPSCWVREGESTGSDLPDWGNDLNEMSEIEKEIVSRACLGVYGEELAGWSPIFPTFLAPASVRRDAAIVALEDHAKEFPLRNRPKPKPDEE